MTSSMRFVEVQGTAEAEPFTLEQMDLMRNHAMLGLSRLFEIQKEALQG
jgi:ribonuclease PH